MIALLSQGALGAACEYEDFVPMYLLLVEDNPTDRMVIQARLRHAFPSALIMAADDPIAMNEHLKRDGCDIVITDYWLGWSDGLSILQRVRDRWPRSRVIMLTGNGGEEVVAGAFKHGLYHYLLKPDGFEELVAVTAAAMESKRREDFNELMAMIVDSIPDAVHSVDASRPDHCDQPRGARQMYGYSDARARWTQQRDPVACRTSRRNPADA